MSAIEVRSVTKNYGDTTALDNVTLTIEPNKIYGLLGRNGAGKTTLLNLMTNKSFPTAGGITVDQEPVMENDSVLSEMYYMTEQNLYPEKLRAREVFKWTKEFYPSFDIDYATELSAKFELDLKKRIKSLSTGYTSILKAITTLASGADILILDEPVLGLDAFHRDMLYKEILVNYNKSPKTIIISTHLIDEVADVLEEVIIIRAGRVILQRSVEELLASAYMVSGDSTQVDQYLNGRRYVGEQNMGRFKSATVLDSSRDKALAKELGLDFGKAELQKLFINLTN